MTALNAETYVPESRFYLYSHSGRGEEVMYYSGFPEDDTFSAEFKYALLFHNMESAVMTGKGLTIPDKHKLCIGKILLAVDPMYFPVVLK